MPLSAGNDAFASAHGFGEVVLAWQEDRLRLRCMIDWFTSTAASSMISNRRRHRRRPHAIPNKMCDAGWDAGRH
ncbi:MAG: hypothetical protein IPK23_14900 [Rhizobiales bacterium]|nr:hypothetical protein [Hyphomicrobiales bacterium]